jgi:hypothetical protein
MKDLISKKTETSLDKKWQKKVMMIIYYYAKF